MNYWLVKSEPSTWSWEDQVRDRVTHWDGVRNYQARGHLQAMKCGDLAFFYHSVKETRIVGIVEVVREYYLDYTDESGRFGMVDVQAVRAVERPVTLAEMKATPELAHLALIKQSRLSVMPVDAASWETILSMSNETS